MYPQGQGQSDDGFAPYTPYWCQSPLAGCNSTLNPNGQGRGWCRVGVLLKCAYEWIAMAKGVVVCVSKTLPPYSLMWGIRRLCVCLFAVMKTFRLNWNRFASFSVWESQGQGTVQLMRGQRKK